MSKLRPNNISGLGDRLTSTISVMLVLFILGLVAVINISFSGVERQIKEKMGFTVVLRDSIPQTIVDNLQARLTKAAYVSSFTYLSAEEVMAEQAKDEKENIVDILGVNPYAPMLDVRVKSQYANVDSLNAIAGQWRADKANVEEVSLNTEMIGSLNRNAHLINTILGVIAVALLLISFVLINNTVRLGVYARRFLIHTMKLVGATGAFIRRPFIIANIIQGVVAALIASALLGGLIVWAQGFDQGLASVLPWGAIAIVMTGMVICGIIICALAAVLATNRYLRGTYDEMF